MPKKTQHPRSRKEICHLLNVILKETLIDKLTDAILTIPEFAAMEARNMIRYRAPSDFSVCSLYTELFFSPEMLTPLRDTLEKDILSTVKHLLFGYLNRLILVWEDLLLSQFYGKGKRSDWFGLGTSPFPRPTPGCGLSYDSIQRRSPGVANLAAPATHFAAMNPAAFRQLLRTTPKSLIDQKGIARIGNIDVLSREYVPRTLLYLWTKADVGIDLPAPRKAGNFLQFVELDSDVHHDGLIGNVVWHGNFRIPPGACARYRLKSRLDGSFSSRVCMRSSHEHDRGTR